MSELDTYIINNYMDYSYEKLAKMITQKFGIDMSLNAIKCKLCRIIKIYNLPHKNKAKHKYTKEQNKWLIDNISNYIYPTLCELFNEKFNVDVNRQSLQKHCLNELGLKIDKTKKGNYKSNIARDVGYERMDDGYLWIKVKEVEGANKKNWIQKHRYVWEKHNGKVPKGYKIVFLDGNCLNCDISNLDCVPVSIQMSLNYVPHNPSLRRCKIKSCILKELLEGYKKN